MSAKPGHARPLGGGLLLVDKPTGCTSHDVVGRLRRVLGTRRVGHAGTLDPIATGLLVIAVERATKLLGHLALTDKTYLATIRVGASTTTDDAEGAVTATAAPSLIAQATEARIRAGVTALTGPILQVPSSVSAIKVDGKRAYDLVRAGEQVELAARPVTITRFDIRELRRAVDHIDLDVVVSCTTGTYIRSLARDLGDALGIGGHLTALRRTNVGPFSVEDAVDVYGAAGVPARGERSEVSADFAMPASLQRSSRLPMRSSRPSPSGRSTLTWRRTCGSDAQFRRPESTACTGCSAPPDCWRWSRSLPGWPGHDWSGIRPTDRRPHTGDRRLQVTIRRKEVRKDGTLARS